MKNTRRSLVLGALTAVSVPAFAQFGGLLGAGKSSGGGNFDADLKNFMDKSFRVEMTASKASLAIASAYATEEERAKLQSLFNDVSKQTDPKEAGAKFQAVKETADAKIKELAAAKSLENDTKNLSAEKQQLLAKGVSNYLLAVFQGKDVISSGQGLMSSVSSNPMNITKAVPAKDALSRLGSAASLAGSSIPKLIGALKGANVSVAEVSASTKEEKVDSI